MNLSMNIGGVRGQSPLGEGVAADTAKAWPLSEQSEPKAEFLFACGAG